MTKIPLREELCPSLTEEIVNKLNEIKIKTVKDLFLSDLSKIRSFSRKIQIDFQLLFQIKTELYQRFGPKVETALQVLNQNDLNCMTFQTGIKRIDEMLLCNTGIKRGEITELNGYPNCGKSQFCYTFAVNFINTYNKSVLYIDTDLTFSFKRIKQIMEKRIEDLHHYSRFGSTQGMDQFQSLIKIMRVLDIPSLLDTIETISYDLETNPNSSFNDLRVVVIDSLTPLMAIELKKHLYLAEIEKEVKCNYSKYLRVMLRSIQLAKQMAAILTNFAAKHSLALIVVNSQSLNLKNRWNNSCRLRINFYEKEVLDPELRRDEILELITFRGIKITQSYDKNIKNNCFDFFRISDYGID